jgi:hypothetical protein
MPLAGSSFLQEKPHKEIFDTYDVMMFLQYNRCEWKLPHIMFLMQWVEEIILLFWSEKVL